MPILPENQVQVAAIVSQEVADQYTEAAQERGISRAAFLRDLMARGWRDYQREQKLLQSIRDAQQEHVA